MKIRANIWHRPCVWASGALLSIVIPLILPCVTKVLDSKPPSRISASVGKGDSQVVLQNIFFSASELPCTVRIPVREQTEHWMPQPSQSDHLLAHQHK